MLRIDILQDEELQEAVKIFISSLLPHENYDSTYFIRNLEVIFKYIKLEEFQMEYRLSGTVGTGSMKDKVDSLAINLRIFKKAYPVCILVASHPSVTAKDALTRGKAITQSPTKDSQTLSNEADEVFILRDNETLQKQELLILQNYKRRDAARVLDDIYLRKRFEVSALIYDESQQALDSVMNLSRQQAIADLMADSDESGYDLD